MFRLTRFRQEFPESDGTFEWNSTTWILVEAHGGDQSGLGYTYGDLGAVSLIERLLAPAVEGRDVMAVAGVWSGMNELADQTVKAGFRRRKAQQHQPTHRKVILWADLPTIFHTSVCEAAVEVLERVGFAVSLPQRSERCGRPLYDFGLLQSRNTCLGRFSTISGTISAWSDNNRAGIELAPPFFATNRLIYSLTM